MQKIIFILIVSATSFMSFSQTIKKITTNNFEGPFSVPLASSTALADFSKPKWQESFEAFYKKNKTDVFQTKLIKNKKMAEKLQSIREHNFQTIANKTTAINPIIATNFRGNDLRSWTPTDNSVAVSNGGYIVSCINEGVEYYDTNGTYLLQNVTWTSFINDSTIIGAKFDPRVLYDNIHDRFIITLLNGTASNTSKVLICFSKTNNPMDGWYIYHLSGDPYNESAWTDYPTIGVSDDDLFINGNRWGNSPNYAWKGSYIYQISLAEGYAGLSIQFGLWNQLIAPNTDELITVYPAMNGQGKSMSEKMYFAAMRPDSGSYVCIVQIDGKLQSTSKTMTISQYNIPHYEACANALEFVPTTNGIDSLSTGSAWIQNAFSLNNIIHFTYTAESQNGWCGINYGRVFLDSSKAITTSYSIAGTDFCYSSIASLGYDTLDKNVAIAFLRSDSSITPESDIISVDNDMNWSTMQTVKTGDTSVNILGPSYNMPERWGDYTGICRKQNATLPEVWMTGAFGANTPPRLASWGTWVAQIKTNDGPVIPAAIASIDRNNANSKIFPNPLQDIFTVEFENEKAGLISIEIVDMQGMKIRTLFEDYLPYSKLNRISFNKLMLSSGTFLVNIKRDNIVFSTNKVLAK